MSVLSSTDIFPDLLTKQNRRPTTAAPRALLLGAAEQSVGGLVGPATEEPQGVVVSSVGAERAWDRLSERRIVGEKGKKNGAVGGIRAFNMAWQPGSVGVVWAPCQVKHEKKRLLGSATRPFRQAHRS